MANSHRDDDAGLGKVVRDAMGAIRTGASNARSSFDKLRALKFEADILSAQGANRITAGGPDEPLLGEWERGGFVVRRLPDDPLCLRISIGEPTFGVEGPSAYLVFRGDPATITTLLRRALAALDGAVR